MIRQTVLIQSIKDDISSVLKIAHPGWDIEDKTSSCSYMDKLDTGSFELWLAREPKSTKQPYGTEGKTQTINNIPVASWTLTPIPGCCGICVSTAALVRPDWRGKGLGKVLNRVRITQARIAGYGLLFCTDVLANEPQTKILIANGWKEIYRFINPRTKNTIGMHIVVL